MSTTEQPQNPPSPPTDKAPSSLWRHADFMKLWAGQTVSLFGSAFSNLALPLIAALTLRATPAEMGILTALNTMPYLVVSLLAGVWVDRLRRRTILIAADMGRALLLVTIPLAAWLGLLSMVQLYLVSFLAGILTVFFDVAGQSYLPALLDRSQLVEGNGKLKLSGSITGVAGPGLAGIIIDALSAPLAILLDVLSYLVSGWCLWLIRRQEEVPQPGRTAMLAQVREGLAVVFKDPLLRAFAGCLATSNFTSTAFFALYILFGTRQLGLDAAALGLIYGLGASGAIGGAILAPRVAARLGVGRAIIVGAILGSLEVLPVVFATPRTALPLLLLSSMIGNFGWVLYSVNETSARQAVVSPALQGRMNATFSFLVSGMLPLGALVGGLLGERLGLRGTIALAAAGSVLSFWWVLFSPVRQLARLPSTPGVTPDGVSI